MSMLPNPLNTGDTIVVLAPSRRIFEDQMLPAWKVFKEWGLNVIKAPHLYASDGYFAGNDDERLADFQNYLDDSSVKAIFCARGGYGATRFVDSLRWPSKGAVSKWIIGFSDITAIHLSAAKAGWTSVHGLMPAQYGYDGIIDSLQSLHDILFYHTCLHEFPSNSGLTATGSVEAPIIGGNLSLLAESLGTSTEIDTDNKILLLEEVDEYLYKVDRMLNQLQRAGKLEKLLGVLLGDFSDMKDTEIPFGKNIYELMSGYFLPLNIPVASGLPFGHEARNIALPLSTPVQMKVHKDACKLSLVHSA